MSRSCFSVFADLSWHPLLLQVLSAPDCCPCSCEPAPVKRELPILLGVYNLRAVIRVGIIDSRRDRSRSSPQEVEFSEENVH